MVKMPQVSRETSYNLYSALLLSADIRADVQMILCDFTSSLSLCVSLSPLADALTAVLTKINRLDIVTLLEGPIFDYGNISGTRCFADDNAVFPDQSDGKV